MPFHIRDSEADKIVRELAALQGLSLTEAVRGAAADKLAQIRLARAAADTRPLRERIKDIQDRVAAYPKTGLKADKAFFDEMSGD
jgi:antitoxin VapB